MTRFPFIGNALKRVTSTILPNPPFVSHRWKSFRFWMAWGWV